MVEGIDVSGLNDGTLTLAAVLISSHGRAGIPAYWSVEKDTVLPVALSVSINSTNDLEYAIPGDNVSVTFEVSEPVRNVEVRIAGGGTGGAARLSTETEECVPEWECTWTPCEDGIKEFVCIDLNECEGEFEPPESGTAECTPDIARLSDGPDSERVHIPPLDSTSQSDEESEQEQPSLTVRRPKESFSTAAVVSIVLFVMVLGIISVLLISGRRGIKPKGPGSEESIAGLTVQGGVFAEQKQEEPKEDSSLSKSVEFIAYAREKGLSDDQIRAAFYNKGWSWEDVESLLKLAEKKNN